MAEYHGQTEARERPTAELLKEFSDQATTLLRKEIALAKVEVAEKGKRAAVGAGMFGGTGVFGFYAFGALTACAILALATAVAAWLAALIVGVVYGAIAGVLALRGKAQVKRATPPVPEQAVDSTKEDLEWVKARAKSARN
jgi:ABC-type dipeptide/oligopeptide/nickel transport system permease subunit